VSKHWKPHGKIVRIRPARGRRRWTKVDSYLREARQTWPAGATAGVLLVGAACLGVVVGSYQALGPRDPVGPEAKIEWNAVAAVPTRTPDAEDVAWQDRTVIASDSEAIQSGLPRPSGARNDAARASFGYCHTGGGTNCVVDGDTFYIGGEKVRVAGIDAPETHPPRCDTEARLGEEATERLRDMLNGGAVTMTSIDRDRDVYGRLLRNVAVNGADVGEAMVSAGVAREYGSGRRPWC
jgi:endonuclease YncB( thermonuclease family)